MVIAPVAVVGTLLGVGVAAQIEEARQASRVADLVRDSEQVARLINEVQAEHREALVLTVEYESAAPGAALPSISDYREAQRGTDARAEDVRSAFGSDLPDDEAQALDYLEGLSVLRERLERGHVPSANIDPAYSSAVDYLIDGLGLDQFSDGSSSTVALLDTVLRADAAHAAFESAVFSAQTRDANALVEYSRAVGAHELFDRQAERFDRIASRDQILTFSGIERGAEENGIEARFAELQVDPSSLQAQTAEELRGTIAAGAEQADSRLEITRTLTEDIAARADDASATALRQALLLIALTLLLFAAWLTFTVLARRSVVRPLAALTDAAQQVVDVAGEELARVADDDSDDTTPLRPRPIPVPVRDDIGRLAEAFNQVQVTAAALLERQVTSRRNVAEMFGNVGHRVSNLVTRQLTLIDAVEREETDADVLERLYRIDHIAVRLQRNADSLMLLAGTRETGVEARPTTLANVIRAALSQIEGYQRVSLRSETEITVAPDIIGDLTLMLAELLENAASFSPSNTPVEVVVRPGTDVTADGGALVEVIDHGLGMTGERLAEENARLVRRERLDLVPTKVLGLFVVGTLARRWGVRVTLGRTPGGGVTGTVWIPAGLLLDEGAGDPAPAPAPALAAAASAPRPTPALAPAPRPAAAPGRPSAPEGPRPLKRRVRGATLAKTSVPADRATPPVRPAVDADAVRHELDEFESAVRRAEQDSALPLPEDAPSPPLEQKESGSDHFNG
ncbi:HAMP domain-containing protein [Streptomyces sp. DSM 44938]|uniref:histidine kinase n=1 Tax=Streptomyces litchfieldiae TaxID=3075543 RepID=A0ABU2MJT7_9ACTN|nr:ATP-binding protein [Streptomyces sp. DSM 44938]MDT0341852.1 HAMP domain-containing protein [Streptomyces sp. DSM 44938]